MKRVKKHVINAAIFIKSSHIAFIFFLEIIIGVLLSVFSLVLFLKIRGEVFEKELSLFDNIIINLFYSIRNPFLTKGMIFISFLGGEFIPGAIIVLVIFLFLKKHIKESILFLFISGMSFSINSILKEIIQRPRPNFHPIIVATDYSFPSGHAMDSLVFYMALTYLVFHFTGSKKLTLIAFLIFGSIVFFIGISRVYLGVHYPTDVIAGYIGGLFWLVSVLLIDRTFIFYKLFKESKKINK